MLEIKVWCHFKYHNEVLVNTIDVSIFVCSVWRWHFTRHIFIKCGVELLSQKKNTCTGHLAVHCLFDEQQNKLDCDGCFTHKLTLPGSSYGSLC